MKRFLNDAKTRIFLAVCLFVICAFVWSSKLPEVETVNRNAVYKQDILTNKHTVPCTSAVWSTQQLKTLMFQVNDCDSCKVVIDGSVDSLTWVVIKDSIVSTALTNIAESSIPAKLRARLTRTATADTTTVWLYGKNY
jgi:hypothetical protein